MTELSHFKKRSLDCLSAKNEERRIYPIANNDLLVMPGRPFPACPVCQSDNISVLAEIYLPDELMFFSTAICCDCLYIFRPVSPSHDWFRKCWKIIAEDDPRIFNPEMEVFRAARYEAYRELLSKYLDGKTVLDIGAGYGTGSLVFQNAGFQIYTVEPEENRVKYIRRHCDFPCYQYDAGEFISEWQHLAMNSNPQVPRYDYIILSQCLEHTDNPVFVMNNIGRLLSPDGILYVEIPLVWDIVEWSDALFLAHKSNFTEANFSYLAKSSGFKIVDSVEFRNGPDEPLDFGAVLTIVQTNLKHQPPKIWESSVDRVRRLYRKGLPEDCTPPLNEIIRYRVPCIEQFYYTMRLNKVRFKMEHGYVCLER